MAANYPSSLPVKDAAGANLSTNPHSVLHDDMYDEIVAIGTELGTVPKGTYASVKARLDALPLGAVGYASVTANQTGISTEADATGLTVTWTAVTGRRYRLSWSLYVQRSPTTIDQGEGTVTVKCTDASNVVKGQIEGFMWTAPSDFAADARTNLSGFTVESGLSGSTTRKIRLASALQDSETVSLIASATAPAHFLIEDIGPA